MKSVLKVGILVLATANAYAQDGNLIGSAVVTAPRALVMDGNQVVGGSASATATQQPVYIVNQPTTPGGMRIYSQPTTVVEASPMVESRADQLRRSRIEVEASTERKIVEKLEASRIEDEQTRLNRLFGQPGAAVVPAAGAAGAFAGAQAGPGGATAGAGAYTGAPLAQPVIAPQPVAVPAGTQAGAIAAAGNGQATAGAVATTVVNVPQREREHDSNHDAYVGLLVGYPDYPGVKNVRANVSAGATAGMSLSDRLAGEAFFIYSSFEIDDVTRFGYQDAPFNWVTTMDQYNVGAAVKYSLLPSRLTPVIGGLGSYTYRSFTDEMSFIGSGASITSHSFDLGGLIGLEARLTERFYVGTDFRYLMNVATRMSDNKTKNNFAYRPYVNTKPIEELSYYIMSLNVRFTF